MMHALGEVVPLKNGDTQVIGALGKCWCGKRMACIEDNPVKAMAGVEDAHTTHRSNMTMIAARR
jgi:hypothetical protein